MQELRDCLAYIKPSLQTSNLGPPSPVTMVGLVLAVGAAIYFTAEKVRDHKKKKQALKAAAASQQAPPYDSIAPASPMRNKAARRSVEQLPPYVFREPPPYQTKDQHLELKATTAA
ncbi:hypothetical protein AYL99_03464 [Fonsecaea erecta]|uniref:Uncharacterized protein n=1 Tax=Fonsecaea erecta TaxID=1367422 RepID=A0A178ZPZ4_9EURO|nr:hypothetical protein AYL99_03464 [Fonsecaea erecta]OAP61263.1 hypothetical protein AYL99_03464 [Fonsecaea erecta]